MSKELAPAQALKKDLSAMREQFAAALPKHIPVDKFVRTLQTAVSTTPKLIEVNRASLFEACMRAAQDGLMPDGREAAVIPTGGKAQYRTMVYGILKKVRNSGELATITSQIVHKNDEFEFYVDEDAEHLRHKPNMFADRGEKIGVYALAKTKDGYLYIEVMTTEQVNAVKKVAQSKGGPWAGPFESEMWRKTVIRRLAKRLPMSSDIENTLYNDDDFGAIEDVEATVETVERDATPPQEETKPTKLKEIIDTEVVEENEVPI